MGYFDRNNFKDKLRCLYLSKEYSIVSVQMFAYVNTEFVVVGIVVAAAVVVVVVVFVIVVALSFTAF